MKTAMKTLSAKVYNQNGKEAGDIALPEAVFGLPWNGDLVHQVITSLMTNKRTPVAHTKNRGDVRGGGKKPWKQKGTGRARHGSIRSPLWVGGGVTHGPRNDKNFTRKVNKNMRTKALFTILSKKHRDGEVLFVESFAVASGKAKDAKAAIASLGTIKGFEALKDRRKNAALMALHKKDANVERAFGNFGNVAIDEARNINPVDLLNYKYLVVAGPKEVVSFLTGKSAKK
jgi:large subunit ribosomal protein L4